MTRRGLVVLGFPILATLALFVAALWLRQADEPIIPPKRVTRVVNGVVVAESIPVPVPSSRRGPSASKGTSQANFAKSPVATDIATAVENARIQSTYQNYRTATLTQNETLQKALFEVLRRDRKAAMECAREDVDRAVTEIDRSFALRALADLER